MGQAEISELERLANLPRLIAPNEYINPNREKQVFYDFVEDYGEALGIEIKVEKLGFVEGYKHDLGQLRNWLKGPHPAKWTYVFEYSQRVVLGPLFYPILGGSTGGINVGRTTTIYLPRYAGVDEMLFGSNKLHEYFHAYHYILARDLKKNGLVKINGYKGFNPEVITPVLRRAPTHQKIKKFEKDIVKEIIKLERRLQ